MLSLKSFTMIFITLPDIKRPLVESRKLNSFDKNNYLVFSPVFQALQSQMLIKIVKSI